MGEVGRNQGRWKLLGTERWLTAHYENPRGESNLFSQTAFSSLFFWPISNALTLMSTNIEAFNCLTDTGSSGFVKQFMYCTVCVCFFFNYLLFIKPAAHFFSIYHGDSVAAEKKFWLKLFSKKNNTFFFLFILLLMGLIHSSFGQHREFTNFSRSRLKFSENNDCSWHSFVISSVLIWVCCFDNRRFNVQFTTDIFALDIGYYFGMTLQLFFILFV